MRTHRKAEAAGRREFVFCNSLSDVFEEFEGKVVNHKGLQLYRDTLDESSPHQDHQVNAEWVPVTLDDLRLCLLKTIVETPCFTWLVLTKRPENVGMMLRRILAPLPYPVQKIIEQAWTDSVILGATVENQEYAKRIDYLHAAPANRRFLSIEPLLGPLVLKDTDLIRHSTQSTHIEWMIVGGESRNDGRTDNVRRMMPEWVYPLLHQSKRLQIPFHFKQWGEINQAGERVGKRAAGNHIDGVQYLERPSH